MQKTKQMQEWGRKTITKAKGGFWEAKANTTCKSKNDSAESELSGDEHEEKGEESKQEEESEEFPRHHT